MDKESYDYGEMISLFGMDPDYVIEGYTMSLMLVYFQQEIAKATKGDSISQRVVGSSSNSLKSLLANSPDIGWDS